MRKPNAVVHFAYLVTIAFKGFDGGIELLLGLLIWVAGPRRFYTFVLSLTAPELEVHPEGRFMQAVRHGISGLANAHVGFIIVYLLIHGALKLALATVLLRGGGRWIYPVASAILIGFVVYMSWHLSERWSNWLCGFAIFDFMTLCLVVNEWVRSGPSSRTA